MTDHAFGRCRRGSIGRCTSGPLRALAGISGKAAFAAAVALLAATALPAGPASAAGGSCVTVTGTVSCTFAYNGTDGTDGSVQTLVVPAGVTWVTVIADGAQGGNGGNGGEGRSGVAVTPGETLWIRAGGDGGTVGSSQGDPSLPGGYNGGGYSTMANGGGASDVRRGADDLAHRVVVGGGGGGSGGAGAGAGGVGGGANGGNGADGGAGGGGGGATPTGGGVGGTGNTSFDGIYWGGVAGGYGAAGANIGPAGGGGLYGGGGGGLCASSIACPPGRNVGGGGGGSGLVPGGCGTPSDPTASCTPGVRSGHGVVVVSWVLVPGLPSAPRSVSAAGGNAQATVTWSAPTSTGGAAIDSYTVSASPGGQTCTWTAGPLSCAVTGLTNGTSYTFTVVAHNAVGTGPLSSPSNAVVPMTSPGPPTAVTATPGKAQATVTWSAPAANGGSPITGYTVTSNPEGKTCSWSSGPLTCTVTGLAPGLTYTFTVRASNIVGSSAPSVASNSVVPWSGSAFHSLVPTRILDSRDVTGAWKAKLTAATAENLTVTGGTAGVPTSAEAVVMNITVTGGDTNSFVTAYPAGASPPTTSNVNFAAGETIANLVTVGVGTNGQVAFANRSGAVDVIADIVGYFDASPGDRYNPVPPTRILDSRGANGGWNGTIAAGAPQTLAVRGVGEVPATAASVILNVTATESTANSYLTVFPSDGPVPMASTVNFAAGQTIANLVTVKLGADGKVAFATNTGSTHVIADVMGYFDATAGDVFHALPPSRILDSRGSTGDWNGPLAAGAPRTLQTTGVGDVPLGATAVIGNTTVTGGTANSFLTAYPADAGVPDTSNVNFAVGQTIANLTAVELSGDGRVGLANASGSTHVIFDVVGYFTSA